MSNLVEIQGQIEKLQKQANEIKSREFDKTVHEILDDGSFWYYRQRPQFRKIAWCKGEVKEGGRDPWGRCGKKEKHFHAGSKIPGTGW